MKVIYNSKGPWCTQVTCQGCKAILEINDQDIYLTALGSGMDDNHAYYYVVDCAICLKYITLDKTTLPEWVQRERRSASKPGPV